MDPDKFLTVKDDIGWQSWNRYMFTCNRYVRNFLCSEISWSKHFVYCLRCFEALFIMLMYRNTPGYINGQLQRGLE